MDLNGYCVPVPADVVLRKTLAREPLINVCELCACTQTLLKMDDTNYVHLNDEYSDQRLTLRQLVKEAQFESYLSESPAPVICECCVKQLCDGLLFRNKCHAINSGLRSLVRLVSQDRLEKVVNTATGMPATVLPYKNLHEYCKTDQFKPSDLKDIIGVQADQSDDDESMIIVRKLTKTQYKCALCPAAKLKKREIERHVLFHYYKNVTQSVVLRRPYCVCCLREDGIVTSVVTAAEAQGDMSLSEVFFEIFDHADVSDLGEVELCTSCFSKIVSLYNFKKMFHASSTIIRDCIRALELCIEHPKRAITVTQHNEDRTIFLMQVYDSLQAVSKDRTKNVAPFLKALKVAEDANEDVIAPEPFNKNQRLGFKMTKRTAKNRYKCTLCGHTSVTLADAKDHRLDHCTPVKSADDLKSQNDSIVACHICGGEFTEILELNAHIVNQHSDIVFCPYCDKYYKEDRNDLYKPHIEFCKSIIKPFSCDLCKACFINKKKLTMHRVRHFPRTVKCDFCEKMFWTLLEVRNHHTKYHRDILGLKFECSMCDLDFDTKIERTRHAATHAPDTRHACRFCASTFHLKTNLIAHKCTGKILQMRTCDKRLNQLKMAAAGEIVPPSDDEGLNECMCNICGKMFKTGRYLKAHMRLHSGVRKDREKLTFSCEKCDYTTCYRKSLETHFNRHHKQSVYSCATCGINFVSRLALVQHMKRHTTDLKTYACDVCSKIFTSNKALVLHMRLHSGETPYECDMCDEKFISASRRQEHRVRKHFEPTLQCAQCAKMFYTQRELKLHAKSCTETEK